MNTNLLHFIAAVLLFGLWAAIAEFGKGTAAEAVLLNAVQLALVGLGVYKTSMAIPGSSNAPSQSDKGDSP